MKNLFIIIMMTLSLSVFAEDMVGAPNEACTSCQAQQNSVANVIEAITQTDEVVPIDLYYKFVKLGTANLKSLTLMGNFIRDNRRPYLRFWN